LTSFRKSLRLGELVAVLLLEIQARDHFGVAAEHDVGAAAAMLVETVIARLRPPGRRRTLRSRGACVEHRVLDLLFAKIAADGSALFDAGGADQNRATFFVVLEDVAGKRAEFLALAFVNHVVVVGADAFLLVGISTTSSL